MIKKLKRTRFEEIFSELLPDTKGKIYNETIYKSKLDRKTKEIIKPIIGKLQQSGEHLDLDGFCLDMEGLFQSISQGEKGHLLKTGKKRLIGEELYKKKKYKRPLSSSSFYREATDDTFRASPHKFY